MKTTPIFALIGAVFLIVVGFLLGKQSNKSTPALEPTQSSAPTQSTTTTVQATTLQPMTVAEDIMANGTIYAKETAEVSAKLTGVSIERVLVDVGDKVKVGQVLAVLDDSAMQDNVSQAQADYEQATASVAQAQADLARVEPLLAIDAVSRQQVDSYRTSLRQAKATQQASLARLNTAKNNLNNTRITAPVAGVISAKNAQVGMVVGGTPLFSLIKGGQLEWQATLAPLDAQRISVGQAVMLMVGEQSVSGQVTHLSPTANAGREIVVHVALPAHPTLKAGMYQRGRFVLGSSTHPAIPSRAVMNTDGYDYVWTLSPYHNKGKSSTPSKPIYQITRTRIHVIARWQDKVATDLPADTLIVANGVSFLTENELVNVVMVSDLMPADEVANP